MFNTFPAAVAGELPIPTHPQKSSFFNESFLFLQE